MPRQKKPGNYYFTKEIENSIVDYINTDDDALRQELFTAVRPALIKIIESIINKYRHRFPYIVYDDDSFERLKQECLAHIIDKMSTYSPDKGKAFSYFSVIVKHYLIGENQKQYKRLKTHVSDDEYPEDDGVDELNTTDDIKEFIPLMVDFFRKYQTIIFNGSVEYTISNAVIELFERSETIENFNKKFLYILIQEKCSSINFTPKGQQITTVVKKMKQYVNVLYDKFLTDGDISGMNVYNMNIN